MDGEHTSEEVVINRDVLLVKSGLEVLDGVRNNTIRHKMEIENAVVKVTKE